MGSPNARMLANGPRVTGMPNLFTPAITWSLLFRYDLVRKGSHCGLCLEEFIFQVAPTFEL